jgi:hypothetical protein
MGKFKNYIEKTSLSIIIFLSLARESKAFSIMEETSDECLKSGTCSVNDFVLLLIAATKFFLGFSGSLALLFFVYGGIMFLISAGNQERVSKGKQILIGSTIGLIIVFSSYTIIGFVLGAMGIADTSGWFTSNPLGEK